MQTLPKALAPEGIKLKLEDLAARKYGTYEMVQIWGYENTIAYASLPKKTTCFSA